MFVLKGHVKLELVCILLFITQYITLNFLAYEEHYDTIYYSRINVGRTADG